MEGEDELDQDCMICGDISNSGGFEIVLGTFSGKLMVLKPGSGGYQVCQQTAICVLFGVLSAVAVDRCM